MAFRASGKNFGGASRLTTAATYVSSGTAATTRSVPLRAITRTLPPTRRPATERSGTPAASSEPPIRRVSFQRIRSPTADRVTRPDDSASNLPSAPQRRTVSPSSTTFADPPVNSTRTNRVPAISEGVGTTTAGRSPGGGAGAGTPASGAGVAPEAAGTRRSASGGRGGGVAQPANRSATATRRGNHLPLGGDTLIPISGRLAGDTLHRIRR